MTANELRSDVNTITGLIRARHETVKVALDLDETWGWTTPEYRAKLRQHLDEGKLTSDDYQLAATMLEHASWQLKDSAGK